MPELPEVENVRRSLAPILLGARIAGARALRPDFAVRGEGGAPARAHDLLGGARVRAIERRGKQLAIVGDDGRAMAIHLGMTGQLLWRVSSTKAASRGAPAQGAKDHVHVEWRVESSAGAGTLSFRDPRRFGGVWTFASLEGLVRARWSALGPDALDATPQVLLMATRASRRAVKALLLDQAVLAGVGNIYADEALFRARVAPRRRGSSLRPEEHVAVAAAIREVLTAAVAAGGSTLRDYRDASGNPGGFQHLHQVYGRAGCPCMACGLTLRAALVAQRTTVWCPTCQPARTGGVPRTQPNPGVFHIGGGSSERQVRQGPGAPSLLASE